MKVKASNRWHQYLTLACMAISLFVSINASAQNNERKGFLLGFGAGPSLNSYKFVTSTFKGESENRVAVSTNFKIGYAPTNRIALYWNSRVAWFNQTEMTNEGKVLTTNGVAGLGASYYLEENVPSAYATATVGFANWFTPFEENAENRTGFGFGLGGGYEFARHWSAEGVVSLGKPSGDFVEVDNWAIRVTINYLMY